MMIASPTAASAAATVITKNTKTWPATPYACANATKLRFTALSMSSTHMNTMIALRRISTPKTPITNRTAEKNSASASILFSALLAQQHRADDGGEQQDARHLEGEQVFIEQRTRERRDRAALRDLLRRETLRQRQAHRRLRLGQREDLGENRDADGAAHHLPADGAHIADLTAAQVEQHDDEQEHDHDRAGVYQNLNGPDELRVEHHIERREAEHRADEPQRR